MDDIEYLKEKYSKDKIISIPNILDKNIANNIYNIISSKIFDRLWYLTIHDGKTKYIYPYRHNRNLSGILNRLKDNKRKGIFTYYINRTFQIPKNIYITKLFQFLISEKFIKSLNEISDKNITELSEVFISKYEKNCFLDIHEDKNKGDIAFVISLTKDWRIDYGGILHFLDDNGDIKNTFSPKFNNLIFFEVNNKSKHFVSSINNYVKNKRYCITGWYK
jgi:SM-20-related protein